MRRFVGILFVAFTLVVLGCSKPSDEVEASPTSDTSAAPREAPKKETEVVFKDIAIGDQEDPSGVQEEFFKDTPAIHIKFGVEAPTGSKIKAVWICEESAVAPANYEIDEMTVELTPGMNVANFSLSRPNDGWPAGKYRTDLYCEDELIEDVTFTIAP